MTTGCPADAAHSNLHQMESYAVSHKDIRHQHQASDTLGVCAGMFWLSIRRRMVKRDPKRPPRPSAAVVPAAKEGKDRAEISGISSAQQNGHATNGTNGYKQETLKSR